MWKGGEKTMEPIHCQICTKTNHHPDGVVVIVATFPQEYFAKNVLEDLEKAHMNPVLSELFTKENIKTLVVELHGIKHIVQLQSLYVESMCRNNNALTVDILTTKNSCDRLLQQLQ